MNKGNAIINNTTPLTRLTTFSMAPSSKHIKWVQIFPKLESNSQIITSPTEYIVHLKESHYAHAFILVITASLSESLGQLSQLVFIYS